MPKQWKSKIIAGFLALVMIVNLFPSSVLTTVFAVGTDSYTVRLTDGKNVLELDGVDVTLTDQNDKTITQTQKTAKGTVTFKNFVNVDTAYTLTVAPVVGYEDVAAIGFTAKAGDTSRDISLTALEKVAVSGVVTDEHGRPYAGATVAVSGYGPEQSVETGRTGAYTVDVYKGKEITITVKPREVDDRYGEGSIKATYNQNTDGVNHSFAVKTFQITTNSDSIQNGTISESVSNVPYGDSRSFQVKANEGYRIQQITVNGVAQQNAAGQKSYTVTIPEVKENAEIVATFYRMTYKVTFTVGKNGQVSYEDGGTQAITGGSVDVEKNFEESTDPSKPTKVTVTATPDPSYRVSKVTVNGGTPQVFTENDKKYTTDLIMTKDHTFEVEFAVNEYRMRVTTDGNGSAVWKDAGTEIIAKHGESAQLHITPNAGYAISSVTANGKQVSFQTTDSDTCVINFHKITENTDVVVNLGKIGQETPHDKLKNDFYSITFSEKELRTYYDGDTYVVVLPGTATVTMEHASPYNGIKFNADYSYGNYKSSITLSETTQINNIYVKKGKYIHDIKKIDVNLKIVIDKDAPVLNEIPEPAWANTDTVTISGTVSDGEGAGVDYLVWSRDKELTNEEILAPAGNKITPKGEDYSFVSAVGEQISTYYVYAVDLVGNISSPIKVQVKIDKKNPAVNAFTFSTDPNTTVEDDINFATFGTVCRETMYVTVTAADAPIASGVKEISLYCGNQLLETLPAENNMATFELTQKDFHDGKEIHAIAEDMAGNHSVITKPTDQDVASKARSNLVQIADDTPTAEILFEDGVKIGDNQWYQGNVNFTVKVQDQVTGIKSVEIRMNGKVLESDLTAPNPIDLRQDFSAGPQKITVQEFKISTSQNPMDGKNTIEVVVTNSAGVKSIVYTEDVYLDTTKPDITGFEIRTLNDNPLDKVVNFLTFGIFCNERVNITVTAADTKASSEVKSITLFFNGKPYETLDVDEENKAIFTVTQKELEKGQVFSGDITAVATDRVQNTTEVPVHPTAVNSDIKNSKLMLEKVDPTANIQVSSGAVDRNPETQDDKDWYKENVVFDVTADDADSGIRNVVIAINDKILVDESFTNEESGDTEIHSKVYQVSTADAERKEDGSYTIWVIVTDNAGNVNETSTCTIYKDISVPYIQKFDFVPQSYVEGSEVVDGSGVIPADYGFYFAEDTDVIISAGDDTPSSGVKSITYYTEDFTDNAEGVRSEEKTVMVNGDNQITVTIPANFKGQLYAKARDNVDNAPDAFTAPDGVIVENPQLHEKEEHISFEKSETSHTAIDGTELYSEDVDVTMTVSDTYSGIRDIQWSVVAPYDTDNNQSGSVTVNNDQSFAEGSDSGWTQTGTDKNLVTQMQKTIRVRNDSNHIVVKVKMTDRAGNTSEKQMELSIDKSHPTISVVYGGDEVHDEQYTDFFSTKRTAVITVTERNFRASDIAYAITNTDGTIPDVDLSSDAAWTTRYDAENPNQSTHVAVVSYTADGDYTFDLSYQDNAGNPANTIGQHAFTIDMTKPVVSVAYDNNAAVNGNYYHADRVATVTIKEHNFDPARVSILGTATDNGETAAFPAASEWRSVGGDNYVATIAYTADAKYSFDIEFRDKAGNSIDDFVPQEFCVDKTAPALEITGVADKSANSGDIIPVITYSDTNFNRDDVTITLSGVNNGAVNYAGSYSDIPNGQVYTYADFEKIQKVDDIYTLTVSLTDMAGNETRKSISFSANRFGSVYDLSGLADINNKYLQAERDIVYTETNVDSLERESILVKLTKNGTPIDLVEGTDYTVEVSGGNGQWSVYTYTIKKSLFAGDGKYSISVYSRDAAGNINENIDETKKAEISFGVDKTAPVIVPADLESGKQYAVDVKKVFVEIKDNLVLESAKIYLNGQEIDYTVEGETYIFEIPESNSLQNVKIVAVDAAGNAYSAEIEDILVSSNVFVRWYNNTPLFVGTIAGAVVLIAAIIVLILIMRKKKQEKKQ